MLKFNWFRGESSSRSSTTVGASFSSGVVCPDGTVMWLCQGDDYSANKGQKSDLSSLQCQSADVDHNHSPQQVHYHYHRLGMGPWLFLGLQMSLAIALLLILSPNSQSPTIEPPMDSLTIY
ncbi:MAG: hypothetical protein AAGD25_17720 [Cyanobacteria bacterium P01_F01_bin.150]